MDEWTIEKIDAAMDAYEAINQRLVLDLNSADATHIASLCNIGLDDYDAFLPYATAYINSPWRKLVRLSKILSGSKNFATEYIDEYSVTAYNLAGQIRTITTDEQPRYLRIYDFHDGNYELELPLNFTYSEPTDIAQLEITPNTYEIYDRTNYSIPITPYLTGLGTEFTHQVYPAVMRLPMLATEPITIRFANPLPTNYIQILNADFYRAKGTFEIREHTQQGTQAGLYDGGGKPYHGQIPEFNPGRLD